MNHFKTFVVLFIAAAIHATCLRAADPTVAPPAAALSPVSAATNAAWERRLPAFNVNNLPLKEVAQALTGKFPEINFIVPDNARDSIVNLTLRNVALQEILDAMEMASEGNLRSLKRGNMVSFSARQSPSGSRENAAQCRVFRLAPYLEGKSESAADLAVKSLYEALAVAWEMLKRHERNVEPPELTIHRETKLLIAVGRERELAVLEQVVRELQGSVVTSKIPVNPGKVFAPKPDEKPSTTPKNF